MAQALPFIAAGMQMFGTLQEGVGQADALKAAAKADEENARRAELAGALESEQIRRDARAADGEAIVATAANGVSVGTGSALDLLRQSAVEREYQVLVARYNAGSQADALRQEGRAKRKAAHKTLQATAIRAGAQAVAFASNTMAQGKVDAAQAAASKPSGALTLPSPRL